MEKQEKITNIKKNIEKQYKREIDVYGYSISRLDAYKEACYQQIMNFLLDTDYLSTCTDNELNYMIDKKYLIDDMCNVFNSLDGVNFCSTYSLKMFLGIYLHLTLDKENKQ